MIIQPRCSERGCRYFRGVVWLDGNEEESETVVCEAFPEGIPKEIAYGSNLHLEPFLGDNGIQFEETGES